MIVLYFTQLFTRHVAYISIHQLLAVGAVFLSRNLVANFAHSAEFFCCLRKFG